MHVKFQPLAKLVPRLGLIGMIAFSKQRLGAEEPPLGTPAQVGLRIKKLQTIFVWTFRIDMLIGIFILLGLGFDAKEPPPSAPDQTGLRIMS